MQYSKLYLRTEALGLFNSISDTVFYLNDLTLILSIIFSLTKLLIEQYIYEIPETFASLQF